MHLNISSSLLRLLLLLLLTTTDYYYWFCSSSIVLPYGLRWHIFGLVLLCTIFSIWMPLVLKWTAFVMEWIGDVGTVDVSHILTRVSKSQISETWAVQPPYLLPTPSLWATLLQAVSTHCLLWYSLFRWSHSTGLLYTSAIRASIAVDMARETLLLQLAVANAHAESLLPAWAQGHPYVAPNWSERKRSESGLSVGGEFKTRERATPSEIGSERLDRLFSDFSVWR